MKERVFSPEYIMGYGLLLGLAAGALFGQILKDIGLGIAIGSSLGITIGALFWRVCCGDKVSALDSLKVFLGGLVVVQIVILVAAFLVYRVYLGA